MRRRKPSVKPVEVYVVTRPPQVYTIHDANRRIAEGLVQLAHSLDLEKVARSVA